MLSQIGILLTLLPRKLQFWLAFNYLPVPHRHLPEHLLILRENMVYFQVSLQFLILNITSALSTAKPTLLHFPYQFTLPFSKSPPIFFLNSSIFLDEVILFFPLFHLKKKVIKRQLPYSGSTTLISLVDTLISASFYIILAPKVKLPICRFHLNPH